MSSRVVKITVSLLLTVSLLCCSFSVFADDKEQENPLMQANDQTIAFLIYEMLRSWGINIQYQGISSFTTDIQNKIQSWIWEYLDEQPSIESVLAWCLDWQFSTDFFGNLVVNDTMLDDVQAFADWLQNKYNLTDNQETIVNPIYSMNGVYELYNCNQWYNCVQYDGVYNYSTVVRDDLFQYYLGTEVNDIYYMYINNLSDNRIYYLYVSLTQQTQVAVSINVMPDGFWTQSTVYGVGYVVSMTKNNQNVWYQKLNPWDTPGNFVRFRPNPAVMFTGYDSDINSFLSTMQIIQTGDVAIITNVINFPLDNPSYTPGDGMIIVDGDPTYQVIEFPESVSIDNLPAVISPTNINDPDLEGVYGEVTPFIRTFSGGMDMMRSIVMQLPEETLACLFALMGAIIIFGFIKIMREH